MCLIPPPVLRFRHSIGDAYMAGAPAFRFGAVQWSSAHFCSHCAGQTNGIANIFPCRPASGCPAHLPPRVSSLAQLHPGITYHGNRLDFVVNKMFGHKVFQMKIHCEPLLSKLELQRAYG